jgi:hypothetical protein
MGHGKTMSGDLNLAERDGRKTTSEDAFFAKASSVRQTPRKEERNGGKR